MKHPQDRSPTTPQTSSFAKNAASAQTADSAVLSDLAQTRDAGPIERVMLGAIRFYQTQISPRMPPACRFQPTCSEYARLAILRYGGSKGVWLGACRIARCHPLHPGGIDPVP